MHKLVLSCIHSCLHLATLYYPMCHSAQSSSLATGTFASISHFNWYETQAERILKWSLVANNEGNYIVVLFIIVVVVVLFLFESLNRSAGSIERCSPFCAEKVTCRSQHYNSGTKNHTCRV